MRSLLLSIAVFTVIFCLPFIHFSLNSDLWTNTGIEGTEIIENIDNYFLGKEELRFFDDNVKSHFSDVKSLIYSGIVIVIAGLLLSFIVSSFMTKQEVLHSLKIAGITNIGLWILLGLWIMISFESFFKLFHQVLFSGNYTFSSNNLVIQLFPQSFWIILSIKLFLMELLLGIILLALPRTFDTVTT